MTMREMLTARGVSTTSVATQCPHCRRAVCAVFHDYRPAEWRCGHGGCDALIATFDGVDLATKGEETR